MDAVLKKCGRDENGCFVFFFSLLLFSQVTTIHAKYISIFYSSIALIVDTMTILERAMKPIFDLSSRIMAVGFASD